MNLNSPNFLKDKQLEKLSTARLINVLRATNSCLRQITGYYDWYEETNPHPQYDSLKKYSLKVRGILNKRPHEACPPRKN